MAGLARIGRPPMVAIYTGAKVELQLEIDFGSADQVTLVLADDRGNRSLIGINPTVGELFFDRTRSGPHFHDAFADRHNSPIKVRDGRVKLRVLVDQSIAEIFADDGETTLTDRFFRGGESLHWSATARNGTARIRSLDIWQVTDARHRSDRTN